MLNKFSKKHFTMLKAHYYHEQQLNITSPPILSLTTFELQCNTFKCTMKANATFAIEPLILLNPFIHLWKTFWTSKVLQSSLSKYLELAKIVAVQVLKSVENKHTFSTLSFMKSKKFNGYMYSLTFSPYKISHMMQLMMIGNRWRLGN
jgi:hypothetical protein